MRLNIERDRIEIIPETEMEIGWIEKVLELQDAEDAVLLVRKNVMNSYKIAYLETKPLPFKE